MTTQNGRDFNEWLRAQLKAKKMSQRQLAHHSGVDHSTISRLVRGDRTPSLGTATKLARGLRELRDDADTPQYLGIVAGTHQSPAARIEYALRSDEALGEAQVRQVMEYYLAIRSRRLAQASGSGITPDHSHAVDRTALGMDRGARMPLDRVPGGRTGMPMPGGQPRERIAPPTQPATALRLVGGNGRSARG
jgi:transcriptional regulator with XRE-family HTH domain